ncbi:hypothetical protein PInf_016469 [Phytophthora infestans]|nr:hypothetical protein PInf_016469 [Phytophthora infestans]
MSSSSSEKSALVLELGACYARCGISGERSPRCVERWQVGEMLHKPLSAAEWRQYLYPKLHSLCFERLLVNPTRRRFVVCEDLLLPRVLRETLLSILFDVLKASAVTLVPSMMSVLYATTNHTALVVDCGWVETRLLPVFKGIPLPYLYDTVPAGSRNCCEVIQRELNSTRDQRMGCSKNVTHVTEAMAEDILERACFAQHKDQLLHVVDAEFETEDNGVLQIPGDLRTEVVEQLLLGDEGTDGTSIVDGIVGVLKRAPVDVRAALLENLLLVGGTAMIPGLAQRVVAEVCEVYITTTSSHLHQLLLIERSLFRPPSHGTYSPGLVARFTLPLKAHACRLFRRKSIVAPKVPVSLTGSLSLTRNSSTTVLDITAVVQ